MQQIKLSGVQGTVFGLALLWAVPVLVGCGGSTAKVTGVVTYKGSPLPSGKITFVGKEGFGTADIQEDGTYTVDAAPIGECTVTIVTEVETPAGAKGALPMDSPNKQMKDAPKDSSIRPDAKDEKEKQREKLKDKGADPMKKKRVVPAPPQYRSTESSHLRYTVKTSKNEFNIELKD